MPDPAASPDAGLEKYRPYLTLLSCAEIDPRLQGKIDLSGVVQQTLLERTWPGSASPTGTRLSRPRGCAGCWPIT